MSIPGWDRVGGVAAVIGGLMWVAKSGVILAGSAQPPYLFEAAPLAYAIVLLALPARLDGSGGAMSRAGQAVAIAVGLATLLNVGEETTGMGEAVPALSNVIDAISGLGPLIGLLLLGWAGRHSSPATWRPGPLELAALYVLAVAGLGGIAGLTAIPESTVERLIEVPILLIGLGWIALGIGLFREGRALDRAPAY